MAAPLKYSPSNGRRFSMAMRRVVTDKSYRMLLPIVPWKFNPWTGSQRPRADIVDDPLGKKIVPPPVVG